MSERLELPERFCVIIEGTVSRARSRSIVTPTSLPHLLDRLFTGSWVTEDAMRAFGLRVTIGEDMDQGDEEPDPLASTIPR